jgi:hypothetical protein
LIKPLLEFGLARGAIILPAQGVGIAQARFTARRSRPTSTCSSPRFPTAAEAGCSVRWPPSLGVVCSSGRLFFWLWRRRFERHSSHETPKALWSPAIQSQSPKAIPMARTADLKSLPHKRGIRSVTSDRLGGTGINKFAGAHDFPKFV